MPKEVIILLLTCLSIQGINSYQYKNLAGPASDFSSFTPPPLEASGMHSRYHVLPLLTLEDSTQHWTHSFPVDQCDIFATTVFAKDPKIFDLKFLLPSGKEVTPNSMHDEHLGYGLAGLYPCRTFLFNEPIPSVGDWSVTVTAISNFTSYPVNASLIVSFYPSDLILQAFIPAENLIAGRSIDIIALLPTMVASEKTDSSVRSIAALDNAVTTIFLPDGSNKTVDMEQSPSNSIRTVKRYSAAGDLYASFEATMSGIYKSLVKVSGQLSDGTNFVRSLWYVFSVVHPSIEITGKVRGSLHTHEISKRDIIDFNIDVKWDESDITYRAFAQVWGHGANREEVPVAWISGLVEVQKRKFCLFSCHYVHMQLDSRWLELADAEQPLKLKSVTLEELTAFITLTTADTLEVVADDKLTGWSPSLKAEDIDIDWEMKEGYNPYRVKKMDNITESGQLLLLHGYCANGNGFMLEYFDDYLLFEDYHQNRLHDEYAKKVVDFLNEKDAKRFSVVGHSQGGPVALHLYTYYQTGLDAVENGRIIQSIGSPYLGTALAGIVALIGGAFGILCGENDDLTYDGAARWVFKIPMTKRAEVYYYTTQYPKAAPLLDRYCVLASQLVLAANNDGITEQGKGVLPDGNHIDNYEGECHVDGMHYPRQLGNIDRSKEINQKAAR